MQLLGKTVVLLMLMALSLFGAEAYMQQQTITPGSPATLILKAEGNDVVFPRVDEVDGFAVNSRQTRQNIVMRNGTFQKRLEQFYTFYPDRNVTVPSFKVMVDGKAQTTKPLHVTMRMLNDTAQTAFLIDASVNNKTPYRGELIKVDVVFKRSIETEVAQMQLIDPQFDGLWMRGNKSNDPYMEDGYVINKISFWLSPQKVGELVIDPFVVNVATKIKGRDIFNMLIDQAQWQRIRSPKITLQVKELPQEASLLGDFTLEVTTDKTDVKTGEPINVTVRIAGAGNIDDVPPVTLNAGDAVIFSDKPTINAHLEKDTYRGSFVQKFSLTASKDVRIEPIEIPYFDTATKTLKTLRSKAIDITVKGSLPKASTVTTPKDEVSETATKVERPIVIPSSLWLWLSIGFVLGIIVMLLKEWSLREKLHHFQLRKSDKELLQQLLPYASKHEELDRWIDTLEKQCYGGAKSTIDRKRIRNILEMNYRRKMR